MSDLMPSPLMRGIARNIERHRPEGGVDWSDLGFDDSRKESQDNWACHSRLAKQVIRDVYDEDFRSNLDDLDDIAVHVTPYVVEGVRLGHFAAQELMQQSEGAMDG